MKNFILIILFLCSPALFGQSDSTFSQMKFKFVGFEDGLYLDCTHELENADTRDYLVNCKDQSISRQFRVHLWLTRYAPLNNTSYELLYWVTETTHLPNQAISLQGRSHTTWFHLEGDAHLKSISTNLGFDNETHSLHLDADLN